MLHTLHTSPYRTDFSALISYVTSADVILFMQDGVLAALNNSIHIRTLEKTGALMYALLPDVQARGLQQRIDSTVTLIDYTQFVQLTVQHFPQIAW